jgi:hypothetical protein
MIMRLELEKGGRAEAREAEGRGRVITNHHESLAIPNSGNAVRLSRINVQNGSDKNCALSKNSVNNTLTAKPVDRWPHEIEAKGTSGKASLVPIEWILLAKDNCIRRCNVLQQSRIPEYPDFLHLQPKCSLPLDRRPDGAGPEHWCRHIWRTFYALHPDPACHADIQSEGPIGPCDFSGNVDLVLELFELVEQLLHPSPHLRCPMILGIVLVMIYHRWRIEPLSYAFVILRGIYCVAIRLEELRSWGVWPLDVFVFQVLGHGILSHCEIDM